MSRVPTEGRKKIAPCRKKLPSSCLPLAYFLDFFYFCLMADYSSAPEFWKPVNPSMNRRCKNHDYYAPCIYMITLRSKKVFGRLSNIVGSTAPGSPRIEVQNTAVGNIITRQLFALPGKYPGIRMLRKVIMPDHIHFLLYVTKRTDLSLSDYISSFMGACSRSFWNSFPESDLSKERVGLFEKGFNDKILLRKGQLERFNHYISDNPLRLKIRLDHPEFFFNKRCVFIDGVNHEAFGNLQLLNHPVIEAVVVSSKYSEQERKKHFETWREVVRQGGVLVGAFVHPEEQRIKEGALKHGASIIQIVSQGFSDKYKPSEKDMTYCAAGKIMEIAYLPYSTRKIPFTKAFCYEMNDFARRIAQL